jgi:response regulator RpfG family c-di-GMP phosphodiesterase
MIERPGDELERLAELSRAKPDEVIEAAMRAARETLGMDMAFVSRIGDGEQEFVEASGDVDSFGLPPGTTIDVDDAYCHRMTEERIPNLIPDVPADDRTKDIAATVGNRVGAYVGVPLRLGDGAVYGSFCCLSHSTQERLTERDVRFMHVLARMVGDHMDRQRAERALLRLEAQADASQGLMAALDARERYTADHSRAVLDLANAVARELALSEPEQIEVGQVALLHDIGKVGVPDAVLQKPGLLDDEEWELMREHPAIGERIVAAIDALAHLAPAIRAEHERWDGTGYPDGLAGDAIPLASQICLACDAYHAMTSDRPYRAAMQAGAAVDELRANAGTQFSPRVVEALVAVLRTHPLAAAAAQRVG